MKTRSIKTIAKLVALVAGCVVTTVSQASPYASAVTNDSGTVSFILNESADNVKVIFGATTNDVGALAAGSHSFSLGAVDPVKVQVTKVSGVGWKTPAGTNLTHSVGTNSLVSPWAGRLWISDSNNPLTRYPTPRGVAVNRNPASPYFGRVYVANSTTGTTAGRSVGRGLFMMNADLSDSPSGFGDNGQPAGAFVVSASSPYQMSLGADDHLYVADFSDANGNVIRVDPGLTISETVFDYTGGFFPTLPPTNHGSIKRVRTTGTLAGGDLKVYTMDEDFTNSIPPHLATQRGSILRYDINSGPLTNQNLPVLLATPSPSWLVTGFQDFDIGTNGYIYAIQNRSAGVEPCVFVIDAATGAPVADTRAIWRQMSGNATNVDIMVNVGYVAVSPDCKYLALGLLPAGQPFGSDVWILPLTNGIPDLGNRMILDAGNINQMRGVDFDAAGNIYTISSGDAQLRVWSPGGSTTITTGNDGSFNIFTPPATVTVTASTPTANEAGPVNGVFTLTRAGDASAALTVTYAVGGTADAGVDYTALSGTATFQPGATSTNITVAILSDSGSEFTETVALTLNSGVTYSLGTPAAATVDILDEDTAEISITGTTTNLLESFVDSTATFQLTRKGLLSAPTTVNLSYSGAAVVGSDYNAPTSVTFLAGAVTTNVFITSANDSVVEAPESFTVTVGAGAYNPGTPTAASGLVYSEDLAPGSVLFADIFDSGASASDWTVNQSSPVDSEATFGYDYSGLGIPEAPNSTGTFAAQKGLRLRAHIGSDTTLTPGISVSPTTGNFTGDYRMRFDMWMNYNGPLPEGGAGSTQHSSYGLGTSGTVPIWAAGGFNDCIWFTASCEGGVADASAVQADYGVFVGNGLQTAASTFYAAGTDSNARGNFNPYYSGLGGSAAPASQLGAYPSQTGRVSAGGLGMAWHAVTLTVQGDNMTWDIDGYRIATVPISTTLGSLQGNNVFLGFHDWFASTNGNPDLQFVLYDNVRVESAVTPIIITSIEIITGGTEVKVSFTANASAVAGDFELHKSGTVAGPYLDDAGANITGAVGSFEAVTAISPGQQFYRIFKP
jgi:hypothetical protein